MNKVIMKGRLSADPEVRYSQGDEPFAIARFSIAVNRDFKKEGQPDADFFNCTAFRKTGEFVEKYFTKGQEMLLIGSLQNRSWEDDTGNKKYATDIIVDSVEFCGKKEDNAPNKPAESKPKQKSKPSSDFVAISESVDDEDLPF